MQAKVIVTVVLVAVAFEWLAIWFDWWPTYTELVESLPPNAAALLVGAGLGALNMVTWAHFRFGR